MSPQVSLHYVQSIVLTLKGISQCVWHLTEEREKDDQRNEKPNNPIGCSTVGRQHHREIGGSNRVLLSSTAFAQSQSQVSVRQAIHSHLLNWIHYRKRRSTSRCLWKRCAQQSSRRSMW
ncbi:hypothetical protein ZHAS_00000258 [Anopheles sinensis]|uniref:Uncharacterized protein n=1 Tax=Anopheles sinensis TaxID=74873 RepID=A0A084VA17_ANOSI|nr:hypothetical protein ZHAS_00000258 [Anopheles sinensis]